jgi:kinesin family member 6/9
MGVPRPHIPYRNSLMTMVLRDSLGGNCKTTMVANVNLSPDFLDESISTCRFAQRVAMVSNVVTVNEDTDPAAVIRRLKQEVRDLQAQVQLLQARALLAVLAAASRHAVTC